MIGAFVAIMSTFMGLITGGFLKILRAELGTLSSDLRGEMGELRSEVRGEMGELRGDMVEVKAEIRVLNNKFDLLDRDVQAIARRVFPERD